MSDVAKKRKIDCGGAMDPATPADLWLKLLNDQRYCDLFFVVGPEGERIGAHKHVLEARSSYFKTMFSERWANRSDTDGNNYEVLLKDDKPSIFRAFLEHIYAFVFCAKPVEAVQLLSLANYYDVQSLVKCCEELLKAPFQLDDVLEIFATAKAFKMPTVLAKAGDTMANYFSQLAKSPTFEKVDEATMMYLLDRDDLNMEECELFTTLLRWADNQINAATEGPKPERSHILKNLVPLVRFPTMGLSDFAQEVSLTNVLTVEAERDLFLYFGLPDGDKRKQVTNKLPYSSVQRKNDMVCLDFYDQDVESRPGKGTYPNVALKKSSNIRDILTISYSAFCGTVAPTRCQVLSLVLEPPKYGEASLFQNSSEVAALNLPIKVAISCSEINTRTNQPNWISEEVVANLGNRQMVLMLDKPWTLTVNKSQSYRITTRFMSDVYKDPAIVRDEQAQMNLRQENFDFFTATSLNDRISVPLNRSSWLFLSLRGEVGPRTGESAYLATSYSSGLHIVRSFQVTYDC